ncbi:TetR/AcrR family transcriptional regulator [Kitasatospora sp. NBC_01287]|uniref:TetR/AcrR family transcriptional regulator n=1 Tax=Kitasatospora sp. NBC_01287 TaxID=2903573 RepID=UPI002253BD1F|nr:TetR/AcrR family transcriptional regulator [Kitasatospora sp. NBC_01287]MCX4744507.1 TetR/AcrR family transcriptional regulator [Kitasatospora sp. NBC_01287]
MDPEPSLRERLVDVGVELVLTEGTASLGLREIARRAGVSHGAPRRYFPTHQALLSAIAHRGFADLAARFATATDGAAPPRAQLAAFARTYVDYALERRGMFELMFRHDLLNSEPNDPIGTSGRPRLRDSSLPLFARFVELIELAELAGQPGQPGGADPAVTAAALWANLHGIVQLWFWGSLQLALDGDRLDPLDRLVTAALDAHLGPVPA